MEKLVQYAATVGRIPIALMFVIAGFSKIAGYGGAQGYMEGFGVPGVLLPLVIATELGCGLLLLVGWRTRLAAFLLAGFTLTATAIFHNNIADSTQYLFFMKNLAIVGGLLVLVAHGPGPLAVDSKA